MVLMVAVLLTAAAQPITAASLSVVGRQQHKSNSKQTQDQQFPIHAILLGRARVPVTSVHRSEQADEEETPDAINPSADSLDQPWTP